MILPNVTDALLGCQDVELALKCYVTESLQLVGKCVEGKMPFRMSGADYEDASLERLIEIFKRLSNNPDLVKRLQNFKKVRNHLAHKGIADHLDRSGELDFPAADEYARRIRQIKNESESLILETNDEANKFRGYLYFADERPTS